MTILTGHLKIRFQDVAGIGDTVSTLCDLTTASITNLMMTAKSSVWHHKVIFRGTIKAEYSRWKWFSQGEAWTYYWAYTDRYSRVRGSPGIPAKFLVWETHWTHRLVVTANIRLSDEKFSSQKTSVKTLQLSSSRKDKDLKFALQCIWTQAGRTKVLCQKKTVTPEPHRLLWMHG